MDNQFLRNTFYVEALKDILDPLECYTTNGNSKGGHYLGSNKAKKPKQRKAQKKARKIQRKNK